MNKISCDVSNCSHNKNACCYANRVNIGGKSAETNEETCCGSFLNRLLYSDLTSCSECGGCCDTLVCFVGSCKHNNNSLCNLGEISVCGNDVEVYTETKCNSFQEK